MMSLLMSFFIFVVLILGDGDPGLIFGRWEDDGMFSCSRIQADFPWGVEIRDFLFDILLFFVSSASGMACGNLGRPGAAHCDHSFCSCFLLSIYFLVLIFFLLVDVRRAWL
jgi:hypothetical protein